MHSYIGKHEIVELIQNNRKGYIIENIVTNDIDEYINNMLIVLKSNGVNINIFTQPKINKLRGNVDNTAPKHQYILLLTIRKDAKINDYTYMDIRNCIRNIVYCNTIQEWVKNKYNK